MTKKESAAQLVSIALDAYDATIECFSDIAVDKLQEFGSVKVILKMGSAPTALSALLQTVHMLEKITNPAKFEPGAQPTVAELTTDFLFPETSTGKGPRNVLLALLKLAKKYRTFMLLGQRAEFSEQAIVDMKPLQYDLQDAYAEVMKWAADYPALARLKDRNHIGTIGSLISALERERKEEAKVHSGGTTVILTRTR